jgi:hypothetical protein
MVAVNLFRFFLSLARRHIFLSFLDWISFGSFSVDCIFP